MSGSEPEHLCFQPESDTSRLALGPTLSHGSHSQREMTSYLDAVSPFCQFPTSPPSPTFSMNWSCCAPRRRISGTQGILGGGEETGEQGSNVPQIKKKTKLENIGLLTWGCLSSTAQITHLLSSCLSSSLPAFLSSFPSGLLLKSQVVHKGNTIKSVKMT